ncbi:MAG: hypothetical protein ABJA89_06500, partial [Lapillicoccus sp.]
MSVGFHRVGGVSVTTTSFVRGRLRVTHPEAYRASTARDRPRSLDGPTPDEIDHVIVDALRDSGFAAIQQVRVAPRAATRGQLGATAPAPVTLSLDLADAEDAVVLAEAGGSYHWLRPRHEQSRDLARPRTAVFDLVVPVTGSRSRGLGGRRADELRATVLSYALPLFSGAAIHALETFVSPGLVRVTGPDPRAWTRCETLDQLGLDPARTHRVLLLVHGTFDSTVGAFGGLTVTPDG